MLKEYIYKTILNLIEYDRLREFVNMRKDTTRPKVELNPSS